MLKTVGLGIQDYEKVIEQNNFYVDKTKFISEWWRSNDDITLITRPRRFGKTLMLSTVEKFFSVRQGNNEELFLFLERIFQRTGTGGRRLFAWVNTDLQLSVPDGERCTM